MALIPELEPLEDGFFTLPPGFKQPPNKQISYSNSRTCYKGPLRAFRLLLFITFIPALFIFIPIYMRYRVFPGQMYPVGMTDMRLIDSKISTTWCQRQVVKSNAMFNAFLLKDQPSISSELVPVSMTRYLQLEDDMKEYWGFYLLKGSVVTVSTCVRRPGASIIVIRGYKHLRDCAYIGDDSSEELDELVEANEKGLLDEETQHRLAEMLKTKVDSPANQPETMRRSKTGVSFHDEALSPKTNTTNQMITHEEVVVLGGDVTDHDPKELKAILDRLHSRRNQKSPGKTPEHLVTLQASHRHRNANVDKDAQKDLHFEDLDGKGEFLSAEDKDTSNYIPSSKNSDYDNTIEQDDKEINPYAHPRKGVITLKGPKSGINKPVLKNDDKIDKTVKSELVSDDNVDNKVKTGLMSEDKGDNKVKTELVSDDNGDTKVKSELVNDDKGDNKAKPEAVSDDNGDEGLREMNGGQIGRTVQITEKGKSGGRRNLDGFNENTSPRSSNEVLEEVYQKLESLGDRGKRILNKLNTRMQDNSKLPEVATPDMSEAEADRRLDELVKLFAEAIDEERRHNKRREERRKANEAARKKRQLMIQQAEMTKEFNMDDEKGNAAIEEEMIPDGYADEHRVVNETTANDMSNSEYWSSFSSSEEALLECEGLLLNLALTPHPTCVMNGSDSAHERAAHTNAFTYRIPANGYYFFVLNSENEKQTNFIRVKFDLQKTVYEVAQKTLVECRNYTEKCYLPLNIFSGEKVVLEVPLRDNDSLWNEEFVVYSECEPRTSIYVICVIAVPLIIVLFAFQ